MVKRPKSILVERGLPLLPILVALGVALAVFGQYVCDDDLIMLRYAERLAEGKGMTWNDGEKVHGVSAILMVLLVAGLGKLGVPLEWGMGLFSVTGTFAAALCVFYAARRVGVSRWFASLLGAALVLFAPFSVWIVTGIGGAVFAAMIGWSAVLATDEHTAATEDGKRRLRRVRLVLVGLLCLVQTVRPDGLLPALCVLVLVAANPVLRGSWRRFSTRSVVPVLGFAAIFAGVQQWYFGTPVPHLAGVKVSLDLGLTRVGWLYVLEFVRGFFPLLLVVPLLLSRGVRRRFRVLGPLLPAAVWVAYLVWVGGDWMPGNRHFAMVLVLVLVSLVRALPLVHLSGFPLRVRAGVLVTVSVVTAVVSMTAPAASRAHLSVTWMQLTCGSSEILEDLFANLDPLLGVEPAGCPPYETGFRSLDMLGLNDIHVSKAVPTGRPVSWDEWISVRSSDATNGSLGRMFIPGHGNGDGAYVWTREPDLIVTCDPTPEAHGCFRSWFEMQERFNFDARYRLLSIDSGSSVPWSVWVRHDAGPLGIQVTTSTEGAMSVVVPAWLLTSRKSALLELGPDAAPRVRLRQGSRVELPPIRLLRGAWDIRGVPADVEVATNDSCASLAYGRLQVESEVCKVTLVLTSSGPGFLTGVVLRSAMP
jgi:hypothetical protein